MVNRGDFGDLEMDVVYFALDTLFRNPNLLNMAPLYIADWKK